jgi:hypothetical protein
MTATIEPVFAPNIDVTPEHRRAQGVKDYKKAFMDEAEKQSLITGPYDMWEHYATVGYREDAYGRDHVSDEGREFCRVMMARAKEADKRRLPMADPIDPRTGLPRVGTASHAGL